MFLPILEAFVDIFVFNESLSSSNFSISASPRLANLSVEEAICILLVLRKKQFLRQPSSSSYQWRQRVNMILVVIVMYVFLISLETLSSAIYGWFS